MRLLELGRVGVLRKDERRREGLGGGGRRGKTGVVRLGLRRKMRVVVHVGDGETAGGRSSRGGRGGGVGLRRREVLVVVAGRWVEVDVERMLVLVCSRGRDRRGLVCEMYRRKQGRSASAKEHRRRKGRLETHAFELRSSDDSKVWIPSQVDANQNQH